MPPRAVTIKIDDREFRRALRQVIELDKKEVPFVLSDQAYRLAAAAMDHTRKATMASISKLFRVTRVGQRNQDLLAKGRKKTKRGYKANARAFGTYNAWRKLKYGRAEGRVSYDTLERHVNARRSSIGWVKAQWLRAMEQVSISGKAFKKKPKGVAKVPAIGKLGGYGIKARKSLNPFAVVGVRLDEEGKITGKASGKVGTYLELGLRAAIPARVADMKNRIERKLAEICKKHSAR